MVAAVVAVVAAAAVAVAVAAVVVAAVRMKLKVVDNSSHIRLRETRHCKRLMIDFLGHQVPGEGPAK